ncbi:glycosyltransferase family 22 protein [Myriangium duriaei CBS 260.36]|uniref:Mannosyltransferase n=1 Tax=Myriangium duriaei CBS 260.36 TaxID=1168546 RepID=A0A9P4J401_9PEZI|nr:glycosyltransferase family 22 protein [Myriangium duriaei CBS 260.36]
MSARKSVAETRQRRRQSIDRVLHDERFSSDKSRSSRTNRARFQKIIATQRPLLIYWLIGFRIVNALLIDTFFQPDEYFQSLEPAWQIAFGENSGAWITWEWREQLRSSIHPYMFAAIYKMAHWVALAANVSPPSLANMLYIAPKLLQAIIAAFMDFYTWKFATKHAPLTSDIPTVTLLLMLLNPWQWFCSTRTLINSVESTLTAAALYYWPWSLFVGLVDDLSSTRASLRKSLTLAALACVLRAPNVIIWISIALCCTVHMVLVNRRILVGALPILFFEAVCCGSAVLAASAIMDRRYYGEWTMPPLQFLQFNLVQGLAIFYGKNRSDYYITEGLPLLMTTALPFALYGMYETLRRTASIRRPWPAVSDQLHILRDTTLACVVLLTTAALSQIPHKEARFLHPLVPILTWFAAHGADVASLFQPWLRRARPLQQVWLLTFVSINVVIAGYVSLRHQRGVVDVTGFLRRDWEGRYLDAATVRMESAPMSVGFLMPCHSTPWRSHLIFEDMSAWALTCEPPLNMTLGERDLYLDEADQFYRSPHTWLDENMRAKSSIRKGADPAMGELDEGVRWLSQDKTEREWPSHLVFFEALEPTMKDYLSGTRYRECWRGFNSDWHDDWRRKGDVVVWCLR